MVGISHFITWHVAVERQCYIHFARRAPPLFPFAPHCQKKATAWSGVCVCVCINIYVYVYACVPVTLLLIFQQSFDNTK